MNGNDMIDNNLIKWYMIQLSAYPTVLLGKQQMQLVA